MTGFTNYTTSFSSDLLDANVYCVEEYDEAFDLHLVTQDGKELKGLKKLVGSGVFNFCKLLTRTREDPETTFD